MGTPMISCFLPSLPPITAELYFSTEAWYRFTKANFIFLTVSNCTMVSVTPGSRECLTMMVAAPAPNSSTSFQGPSFGIGGSHIPSSCAICKARFTFPRFCFMVVGSRLQKASKFTCLRYFISSVPSLDVSEMAKFTLKGGEKMISRSRLSKTKLVFLTYQQIAFLIFWESNREPIPFHRCVTTARSPIAARGQEICKKNSLSVRNHQATVIAGRSHRPPLSWFARDARVHACLRAKR
jgi:hypothetical protein